MYEHTASFDPNTMAEGAISRKESFSDTTPPCPEDVSAYANGVAAVTSAGIGYPQPQQLGLNAGNSFHNENLSKHLVQEVIDVLSYDQSAWDPNVQEFQDLGYPNHHHQHQHQNQNQQQFQQIETQTVLDPASYPSSSDLLNLLHLPRCSSSSKISNFSNSMGFLSDNIPISIGPDVMYDPLFHLNLPPPQQPPLALRELFQSLPRGYSLPATSSKEVVVMEGNDGGGGQMVVENGVVLEFNRGNGGKGREGKGAKHFATEKQRREQLNGKYQVLRSLIPSPTKADRASVVGDAIDYIRELIRTVNELKLLVEKKRFGRDQKRRKTNDHDHHHDQEEDGGGGGDHDNDHNNNGNDEDNNNNNKCKMMMMVKTEFGESDGRTRTSWLQRKSKDTEVDVRIIDDEVNIKLVQRKKISCLLYVSRVLHELHLDLHHVAGGHVGEYSSFLFNSKICEGSSVHATAIANKVIDVLDRQYAAAVTHSNSTYKS